MVVVCGAGIVGLSIARELVRRGFKVLVLEKENRLGVHASGNNSGVIHSGIYYRSKSLKAELCVKGNKYMKNYIKEKGLPLIENGKVIVARDERDLKTLEILKERARLNGVKVEMVDERELKRIEPLAKTFGYALYVESTANTDPIKVLESLKEDIEIEGKGKVLLGVKFIKPLSKNEILTSEGKIGFDMFINCAGIFADKVAHKFGDAEEYHILPFKGSYWELVGDKIAYIKGNIYPAPNLNLPFLGVHASRSPAGKIFVGPNATLSLGRYGNLSSEILEILPSFLHLALKNPEIIRYAYRETITKFLGIFRELERIMDIKGLKIIPSKKFGVRSQVINFYEGRMENDFILIKRGNIIHILNAVSPAFTSSLAFAEYVIDRYFLR